MHHIDPKDTEVPYLCKLKESDRLERYWMEADSVELYKKTNEVAEPAVFKTQQDIWKYLAETEEHKVIHNSGNVIMGFKDGKLYDYKETDELWRFDDPSFWKPYIEPEKKDWWELNGNKPVACWYGDVIDEGTGKPRLLGFMVRDLENSTFQIANEWCSWKYAIPLTEGEYKQYLLSEQLK